MVLSAGIVFAVLGAILVVVFWSGPKEPEYQGKKLSEWLAGVYKNPSETTVAVKSIGTNAIPLRAPHTLVLMCALQYRSLSGVVLISWRATCWRDLQQIRYLFRSSTSIYITAPRVRTLGSDGVLSTLWKISRCMQQNFTRGEQVLNGRPWSREERWRIRMQVCGQRRRMCCEGSRRRLRQMA